MSQQNTQSNPVKPMPVKAKMKPSDFPGMDSKAYNNPAFNKKYGDKPTKSTLPKKTPMKSPMKKVPIVKKKVSLPSKARVMSSLKKTMGY
jgi:hypothetical protein